MVSDSTGETTQSVMRASIAQFEDLDLQEHIWPMVRSTAQMKAVIAVSSLIIILFFLYPAPVLTNAAAAAAALFSG